MTEKHRCPHCKTEITTVNVIAPAEITVAIMAEAEIDLADLPAMQVEYDYHGRRYLPNFTFAGSHETLDGNLGHRNLEIDSTDHRGNSQVQIYCQHCDGELPHEFLDIPVPEPQSLVADRPSGDVREMMIEAEGRGEDASYEAAADALAGDA